MKGKRGYIWGRRIVGDVLMGNDPVTQRWGRVYAPAVSLTNIAQDYEETSVTQNFELGSKMEVDERIFRYARAGAPITNPYTYRCSINADLNAPTTWGMALPAPGIAVGDTVIRVTHGNYGIVATTVAANELVGGWIEIWPAVGTFAWRRILANTASTAGVPTYIDITVDRPMTFVCAAGAGTAALHRSAYRNIQQAGLYVGEQSAKGVAPVTVASGSYFWLQTAGPCMIAATGNQPGQTANFRDVYMNADGTICTLTTVAVIGATTSAQRIGFVMGASTLADGNCDIMLQLDQ